MLYIMKFLLNFVLPPGLFIVLLAVSAWYVGRASRTTAKLLAALALLLYAASAPWTVEPLMRAWEQRYTPPPSVSGDVLVVLTGGAVAGTNDTDGIDSLNGSTLSRTVTTAELYKKYKLPIIVSGGQVFADTGNEGRIVKRKLLSLGVPESAILLDDTSRSTEENARNTSAILKEHRFNEPILITSAFHMERSLHHFREEGISPIPYPTEYRVSPQPSFYGNKLAPSASSMSLLSTLLKEVLGVLQ
ncbi:YdcF family protein [Paenibacillus hamazuiensis]|uniref:YdcF family protein n=1 Tax=Paenibacillus hamazuiensis TaxID=2936508 RepID=UPI00200E95FF|nr:YdcF family protein [Paenibacillus hamazuiensis]